MGIDMWSIVGLTADFLLLSLLNSWWKRAQKSTDEIREAPSYQIDDQLVAKVKNSKDGCIPYVCLEGKVVPEDQVLHSRHVEGMSGVVHHFQIDEHKSKKLAGTWSDLKTSIQDKIQTVPFLLQGLRQTKQPVSVHVADPLEASFIEDDLTIIHDHFDASTSDGFVTSTLKTLIAGEYVKGYHEKEKMLLTNTVLLGIGEVRNVDGKLTIKPPQSGAMYVLTKMSKSELIKKLENKTFWIKIFVYTTALIGVGIVCRLSYKYYKQFKAERDRERSLAEMRALRQQAQERQNQRRASGEGQDDYDSNVCIVCLTNPREIVLLNCGHICLCAECLHELPEPLMCPFCRQPVERYVTTFNP